MEQLSNATVFIIFLAIFMPIVITFLISYVYYKNTCNIFKQLFNENREYITKLKIFKTLINFIIFSFAFIFVIYEDNKSLKYLSNISISKIEHKHINDIMGVLDINIIFLILIPLFIISLYNLLKLNIYIILRYVYQKYSNDYGLLEHLYKNELKDAVSSFKMLKEDCEKNKKVFIYIYDYLNENDANKLLNALVQLEMKEEALFIIKYYKFYSYTPIKTFYKNK